MNFQNYQLYRQMLKKEREYSQPHLEANLVKYFNGRPGLMHNVVRCDFMVLIFFKAPANLIILGVLREGIITKRR